MTEDKMNDIEFKMKSISAVIQELIEFEVEKRIDSSYKGKYEFLVQQVKTERQHAIIRVSNFSATGMTIQTAIEEGYLNACNNILDNIEPE